MVVAGETSRAVVEAKAAWWVEAYPLVASWARALEPAFACQVTQNLLQELVWALPMVWGSPSAVLLA